MNERTNNSITSIEELQQKTANHIVSEDHNLTLDAHKIKEAGERLNSASGNYLWSIILGYAGTIIFFIIFTTSVMPDIIRGGEPEFEDIFFSSLILIISIIPVILFITNLSRASLKLEDSILEYSPKTRYSFIFPNKLKNTNLPGMLASGGIVITPDKKNKKTLILGREDIANYLSFEEATQLSEMQININGYTDWFLPNKEEMQQAFSNLNNNDENRPLKGKYWITNSDNSSYKEKLYMFDFDNGKIVEQDSSSKGKVRLMRIGKMYNRENKSHQQKQDL